MGKGLVQYYLCKDYYNLDEDQNKIVCHHKEGFKISKNKQKTKK